MGTLHGLALCAGVGGLELGFDLAFGPASIECWVEHDPKKARVLQARMRDGIFADAPIWDDLRTFNGREWRGIDFLAAGWPCRPFSTASRGRATAPDLWGSVRRVVAQSRPRLVALENVPRAPWASVGNSLERLGYSVAHCVTCPSTLGAPHRRPRGYLLAYSDREGEPRRALDAEVARIPPLADRGTRDDAGGLGVPNGVAPRMDRLRACGDGVVPLAAAYAFRTLAARAGLVI